VRIRVLKLGTVCLDKATELEGTLTHWLIDLGGAVNYFFQPKGLSDEGQPVQKLYLEEARLKVNETDFEEVEIPFEILGTQVTSKASGFTGMAIEFIRHINGCFHVVIQPKGMSQKTKMPIRKCDFDLRECTGDKITELSEAALARSKEINPSPTGDMAEQDMPTSFLETLPQR
jgi:hypothetical protein